MSLSKKLFVFAVLMFFGASSLYGVDPRQIRTVSDHVLYSTLFTTGLVDPDGDAEVSVSTLVELDFSDKVDPRYKITGVTIITDEEIKIAFVAPGVNATDGTDEVGDFFLGAGDVGVFPIPNLRVLKLENTGSAATVHYYVWCARIRN